MAEIDDFRYRLVTAEKALAQQTITGFVSFEGAAAVSQVTTQGTAQMREVLSFIASNYTKAIKSKRGSFRQMYNSVGEEALGAIRASYQEVNHGPSGYRPNERDSGGKLMNALTSSQMYNAEYDGISFINTEYLDRQAKQWYRLNFGAGPAEGFNVRPNRSASNTRITLFGEDTGMSMGLGSFGPSRNFYVPAGRFDSEQSGAAFYPGSQFTRSKSTPFHRGSMSRTGIAAQHFLDEGVRSIAINAPRGNEILLRKIAEEALAGGRNVFAKQAGVNNEMLQGIRQLTQGQLILQERTSEDLARLERLQERTILYGAAGRRY